MKNWLYLKYLNNTGFVYIFKMFICDMYRKKDIRMIVKIKLKVLYNKF